MLGYFTDCAALHALHYHEMMSFKQKKYQKKIAKLSDLLTIRLIIERIGQWMILQRLKIIPRNFGYVVRWVDQSVGCSKVPDINGIGLMEDRATCRIVVNILLIGYIMVFVVKNKF